MSKQQVSQLVSSLIDVETAAERCGVSPRQIRNLVYKRQIPFVKIGRLVRFHPLALDQWIADNTYTPDGAA